MKSLLHQLENNEAILLMYLAGELPAEDRREVEQLLAADAGMRRELAVMDTLRAEVTRELAAQDALQPLRGGAAAGRTFAAAVRRQRLIDLAKPAAPVARKTRAAWWAYPATVAAGIALAMSVWWHVADDGTGKPIGSTVPFVDTDDAPASDTRLADIWASPKSTDLVAELVPDSLEAEMQDAIALGEFNR